MAYTPTDWNDDAAPAINATNLDKIEQGIADAHTTADAAIAKAILDAAGDLVSASAADTPARLALGSNDEVLSVNSSALDYRKVVNAMVDDAAAVAYSKLDLGDSIVNADIAAAAAIAYSKLNLAASIVNADINASAAIAYSKLNLASSIVNADIASAAAIAYSKLALTNEIVNADIDDAAAIAYSKLALTDSIVNADIDSAAAIDQSKLAFSGWSSYTPVLSAATTPPTLGTGSTAAGSYFRVGDLVVVQARIIFGSAGTNAGSGTYSFSLPVNCSTATENACVGSGFLLDSSVGDFRVVSLILNTTSTTFMLAEGANAVTEASPWAWAASDQITLNMMYEAA